MFDEEVDRGERPDLLSSPDVFTCNRTFKGGRSGEMCLLSAVAVFADVRVWMAYKLGITVDRVRARTSAKSACQKLTSKVLRFVRLQGTDEMPSYV